MSQRTRARRREPGVTRIPSRRSDLIYGLAVLLVGSVVLGLL
jgi:hypothetical protein